MQQPQYNQAQMQQMLAQALAQQNNNQNPDNQLPMVPVISPGGQKPGGGGGMPSMPSLGTLNSWANAGGADDGAEEAGADGADSANSGSGLFSGLGSMFGLGGDSAAAGAGADAGGDAGLDSGLASAGPFGWAALAGIGADQLSDGRSTRALNAASGIPGTGGDTDQGDWSILRDGGLSKLGAPDWINPQNWFNG